MALDGRLIDVNLQEVDDTGSSGLYREFEPNFEEAHKKAVKAVEYLNGLFSRPKRPGVIVRIYNYFRGK